MTDTDTQLRILLVDDDPMVCRVVQRAIEGWYGSAVVVAHDGDGALSALAESPFDLVVTDLKMPGPNGVEVARAARSAERAAAVVVMTGYAIERDEADIAACGAVLLRKPFDARELRIAVQRALGERA